MRADLVHSMVDFRRDFTRELASLARALEPNESDRSDFESYAREWAKWRRTAIHPGVVQDVYLWQQGPTHSQLLKIRLPGEEPERVEWPPELEPLRAMAITGLPNSRMLFRAPEVLPPGPGRAPPESGQVAITFGLPSQAITAVSDAPFAQGSVSVAGPEPGAIGGRFEVRHDPHDAQ